MSAADDATTVAELREFLTRQRQALSEAGRPDLAAIAHIVVDVDGVHLRCAEAERGDPDPTVRKAVSIDPEFTEATP